MKLARLRALTHPVSFPFSVFSEVEMKLARLRALTHGVGVAGTGVGVAVEMKLARLRALTHI